MTMEHRWQKRNCSILDVAVYKRGERLGYAQTVDVSLEGLGLSCSTLNLQAGDVVDIELPKEGHYDYGRYLVVHVGQGRCGLMLISLLGHDKPQHSGPVAGHA